MRKGFSLIEFVMVIAILAILAGISIPYLIRYYRVYKYNEYVLQVESTLKWARLIAMERGINVGICGIGQTISIVNAGISRNINCGAQVIRSVSIGSADQSFVNFQFSNLPAGFDPRGLAFISGGSDATISIRRIDEVSICTQYVIRSMSGFIERRQCQ